MPSAPRPLITANQVTLARLIPMPLLSWLLYRGADLGYRDNVYMWSALIAGTLIGCTDWIDGLLARKYGPTVLGGLSIRSPTRSSSRSPTRRSSTPDSRWCRGGRSR